MNRDGVDVDYIWLVVWNIFYFPINIGFLVIPIDELIFFRGVAQPPTRYIYIFSSIQLAIQVLYARYANHPQESSTLSSIRAFLAKASPATAAGPAKPCDPEIVAVPEKVQGSWGNMVGKRQGTVMHTI